MNVAEQRFLELVPTYLRELVSELKAIKEELKALSKRLDEQDTTAV